MDPVFGLTDDLMLHMMGKISQMLNISKGYPYTPTLNKSVTGPYKADFMQDTNQEIKGLEKYFIWIIVSRNSVTGDHILKSTWDFKVK